MLTSAQVTRRPPGGPRSRSCASCVGARALPSATCPKCRVLRRPGSRDRRRRASRSPSELRRRGGGADARAHRTKATAQRTTGSAAAEDEADGVRRGAREDAARLRESTSAEIERMQAQVHARSADMVAKAQADADRIRMEAPTTLERAKAETKTLVARCHAERRVLHRQARDAATKTLATPTFAPARCRARRGRSPVMSRPTAPRRRQPRSARFLAALKRGRLAARCAGGPLEHAGETRSLPQPAAGGRSGGGAGGRAGGGAGGRAGGGAGSVSARQPTRAAAAAHADRRAGAPPAHGEGKLHRATQRAGSGEVLDVPESVPPSEIAEPSAPDHLRRRRLLRPRRNASLRAPCTTLAKTSTFAGAIAQLGERADWQSRGRRFEPG